MKHSKTMTKYTYLELLWLTRDTKTIYSLLQRTLTSHVFTFNLGDVDGRRNSMKDEEIISDYLIQRHPGMFIKGRSRDLGDVWMGDLPINIKVVEDRPTQANNLVGSAHFVKYVFGDPTCTNNVEIAKTLINTPADRELKNYGLIIVAKNSQRVWVGNFDQIPEQHIKVNPSNGLQITWPNGHVERTNQEYRDLMEYKMVELMKKWAEPLKVYETLKTNEQGTGTVLYN
jgi:hypothetical protein